MEDVASTSDEQLSLSESSGSSLSFKTSHPTISIYLPSRRCGRLLFSFMGENFIWEVTLPSLQIDDYLPTSLPVVPATTIHDYLKHHTTFGRTVTQLIRRIRSRRTRTFHRRRTRRTSHRRCADRRNVQLHSVGRRPSDLHSNR